MQLPEIARRAPPLFWSLVHGTIDDATIDGVVLVGCVGVWVVDPTIELLPPPKPIHKSLMCLI